MASYDESPVPRGTSRRWEVVLADEPPAEEEAVARRTALDVGADHRVLQGLSEADLAAIPLVPEGEPLTGYGVYLDLHDPGRADFLAEGGDLVRPGQRIVARQAVPAELWDALLEACAEVTGRPRRRSA